jgi:hypothetical protein
MGSRCVGTPTSPTGEAQEYLKVEHTRKKIEKLNIAVARISRMKESFLLE